MQRTSGEWVHESELAPSSGRSADSAQKGGLRQWARHLWNRIAPFHLDWIQVEVSASCNASCTYCPVSRFRNQRSQVLMEMDVFERLEPALASTDLAFLQGWGEPLLHPHFWEMAARAKAKGARVGFGTSASLLDAECRRRLLASGVDIVGVSLAGATAATHDRLREGCGFEMIDARLRELAAEKERAGTESPEIHLAFMMLSSNLHELEGLADLAELWGATDIVASNLTLVLDRTLEQESLFTHPARWPEVSAQLRRVQAGAKRRGIRFRAYWPDTEEALPLCTENVLRACFVSARGDVSPCALAAVGLEEGAQATRLFEGGEYPLARLSFGNLRDRSLEEIWRSEAARSFRRVFRDRWSRFRRGRAELPSPCRTCYKLNESWERGELGELLAGHAQTLESAGAEHESYRGRLEEKHSLNVLIPPQEDRDLVHRSIYQELCLGKVLDGSRTEYCRIASDLVKRGRSSHIPWTLHPMALRDVVPDD